MAYRSRLGAAAAALLSILVATTGADAQLFWNPPDFSGQPVNGDEPGIAQPMPGATPEELQANLVWTLRAGLNVAALQCQFEPALRSVKLYNDIIAHHDHEFDQAQAALVGYFSRQTGGGASAPAAKPAKAAAPKGKGKAAKSPGVGGTKAGNNAFDQYSTRTYNSFSTLHAQYGFCQTAAKLGRIALGMPKGELHTVATQYLREFRNSLIPAGDNFLPLKLEYVEIPALRSLPDNCFDKNGDVIFRKKQCRI
ncbi:MAG: hypothetical protein JOY99_11170 [Sphingomonadaceae bacterium]|nr:hypothetical protein [Sphingomonadaceae bacterium]